MNKPFRGTGHQGWSSNISITTFKKVELLSEPHLTLDKEAVDLVFLVLDAPAHIVKLGQQPCADRAVTAPQRSKELFLHQPFPRVDGTIAVIADKPVRMKTEFVSTVSHEMRTPLNSIGGSLGLVMGGAAGPLDDKARRLIGIAHSNCNA